MIRKLLIANRGEIAVRIIRACREMGIATVAVYSEADEESLHTQLADEAICIGPGPSAQSYLNMEQIISATMVSGADAIHPGFGFLSENARFAELCEKCGITFVGPPSKVIRMLGGGGKGMRVANTPEEFPEAYATARKESEIAFGDGTMYIEHFVVNPRHIEFQILADSFGNVIHLGERDCSIQRNHQKMIEESPSAAVSPELREKMGHAAVTAAKAAGYVNAGTIEFLLELNTRIQVEHPVTEWVTGIDLVKEQLKIASGMPLEIAQEDVRIQGHAIECRINAENPQKNFRPSPGTIQGAHFPGGNGIRVDTCVYNGCKIPPYYDSMLAKLIVHAGNRKEAIAKMQSALGEVIIDGIDTNIDYQYEILKDEDYQSGNFDTGFLASHIIAGVKINEN